MKAKLSFILILLVLFTTYTPVFAGTFLDKIQVIKHSLAPLNTSEYCVRCQWKAIITPYLTQDLWIGDNAMVAANERLTIPVIAAFKLGETKWQNEFSQLFTRWMANDNLTYATLDRDSILSRSEWIHLCSLFVGLAGEYNKPELIPVGMLSYLYNETHILWRTRANTWYCAVDGGAEYVGIRNLTIWRLTNPAVARSHYDAIIDTDMFLFATAANLRIYEKYQVAPSSWNSTFTDILDYSKLVCDARGNTTDGGNGWLFQVGKWRDHNDYKYSVYNSTPLGPAFVDNFVTEDSSHTNRWPVWLDSLAKAYDSVDNGYYFNSIKHKVDYQFKTHVLNTTLSHPRMTNWMDGRNGYYVQHGSSTVEYGPFALTGTLITGWWVMLGSEEVKSVYQNIVWPLSSDAINSYLTPGSTTQSYYNRGISELIMKLGWQIAEI